MEMMMMILCRYVLSEHLVRNVQIDVIVVKQVSMNIAHSERAFLHCRLS